MATNAAFLNQPANLSFKSAIFIMTNTSVFFKCANFNYSKWALAIIVHYGYRCANLKFLSNQL